MPKKPLPTVRPGDEKLGQETIMDRALAARYGVPYVHMAVFAIDVDRVRAELEMQQDPEYAAAADEHADAVPEAPAHELPFGWEVFLTEVYLLAWVDPRDEAQRSMVEDGCLAVLERPSEPEPALGAQLPFAVYDAVRRGAWPEELMALFRPWKRRADPLTRELAPLWENAADTAAALAEACLDVDIQPPLAEPTLDALATIEGGEVTLPGPSPA